MDQEPVVSLKLSKVSVVRPEMRDWAALPVILLKFRDMEIYREYCLWKITEVPELVGRAVSALR